MGRGTRRDPFKNFNFRMAIGAVVAGVAALGIVRKLFKAVRRVERRPPGVYIEEVRTGTRPIEGVGTSTAGFAGSTRKQAGTRRKASRPKSDASAS